MVNPVAIREARDEVATNISSLGYDGTVLLYAGGIFFTIGGADAVQKHRIAGVQRVAGLRHGKGWCHRLK